MRVGSHQFLRLAFLQDIAILVIDGVVVVAARGRPGRVNVVENYGLRVIGEFRYAHSRFQSCGYAERIDYSAAVVAYQIDRLTRLQTEGAVEAALGSIPVGEEQHRLARPEHALEVILWNEVSAQVIPVIGQEAAAELHTAVGSVEQLYPGGLLPVAVVQLHTVGLGLAYDEVPDVLREARDTACECGEQQCYQFPFHSVSHYRGILSCFLSGWATFLPARDSRALITRKRVLRGSMTSSIYPYEAAL